MSGWDRWRQLPRLFEKHSAGAAMIIMTIGASYAAPVSNPDLSGGAAFQVGRCNTAGIASACGGCASTMSSAKEANATAAAIARNAADAEFTESGASAETPAFY